MGDSEFTRERWHLSKAVPISIIGFILIQTASLVVSDIVWRTKFEARLATVEINYDKHDKIDKEKQDDQDHRITALEGLLPRLAVFETRQLDVIKRLDNNGDKLDKIFNELRTRK